MATNLPPPPRSRYANMDDFPQELLDKILEQISFSDISRLSRLTPRLRARLLPLLWAHEESCVFDASKKVSIPPLTLAIYTRSVERVLQALAGGAAIEPPVEMSCRNPSFPSNVPIYKRARDVPLCAAAWLMGKDIGSAHDRSVEVMAACLDHGGNINFKVPFGSFNFSYTTPLLQFLCAIEGPVWAGSTETPTADGFGPIAKLRFFLDRGANPMELSLRRKDLRKVIDPDEHAGWGGFLNIRQQLPTPMPAQYLLDHWGVDYLCHPNFALAVKMLLTHPGVDSVVAAKVLARACEGEYDKYVGTYKLTSERRDPPPRQNGEFTSGWGALLDALISHYGTQDELDRMLFTFVVRTGTCPVLDYTFCCYSGCEHRITDRAIATIRHLVAAGADINHRFADRRVSPPEQGPTALHNICWWITKDYTWGELTEVTETAFRYHEHHIEYERLGFLRFLIRECGATVPDPEVFPKLVKKNLLLYCRICHDDAQALVELVSELSPTKDAGTGKEGYSRKELKRLLWPNWPNW